MSDQRLEVVGLRKAYGDHVVLDRLDLAVEAGETVALTGANGSGKSTLLRCLAGLMSHGGSILVDGEPVAAQRASLGYLPQHVAFPGWATVGDVLHYFARLRRSQPPLGRFPADFVPDLAQPVKTLSGGQRQRVAIAIALTGGPSLLLLDEPVASLDDSSVPALLDTLEKFTSGGGSVLLASPRHDASSLRPDRVIRLDDGRLVPGYLVQPPSAEDGTTRFRLVGE